MPFLKNNLQTTATLLQTLLDDESFLNLFQSVETLLTQTLHKGHRIFIAGNGGSASQAQHFAAELVVRYQHERKGLAAIALTADSTVLTACANDFGYEQIFSRQIEAVGQPGDVFIGLTTSGSSPNIVSAFKTARAEGLRVIGFFGAQSPSSHLVDLALHVPSSETPRIQEVHLALIHALCEAIEIHFKASK